MTHKGVAADAVPDVGTRQQLVSKFAPPVSTRAPAWSGVWAHTAQYIYECELENKTAGLKGFTTTQRNAYEEPSELTSLYETAGTALRKRIEQLRAMFLV